MDDTKNKWRGSLGIGFEEEALLGGGRDNVKE